MPIYEYEGQQYDISDEDPKVAKGKILEYLKQQEPTLPPPTPETGFIPSVKRGYLGLESLLADVAPAMAGRVGEKLNVPGAKEYADRQMREAAEAQKYIQEKYPSEIPSFTDIKGPGDALTYIVESVGELIPSMLPSLFTGGAAGLVGRGAIAAAKQAAEKSALASIAEGVTAKEAQDIALKAGVEAAKKAALKYEATGAVVGSAAQNIPEVYQNIAESTGKEDLGAALVAGGFNAVLDAITPLNLMRIARKGNITNNELAGAWAKRLGKGFTEGLITEGGTEAVQEMSTAAAEKFVDNNKDFFTKDNFVRFIDAGLKGGIGGGVATGATNLALGQRPEKAAPPLTPPGQEEVAPPQEPTTETEATKPIDLPDLFNPDGTIKTSTEATGEEKATKKTKATTIVPAEVMAKGKEQAAAESVTQAAPAPLDISGLSKNAQYLVNVLDAGHTPPENKISEKQLKKISVDNGLEYIPSEQPQQLVERLKAKTAEAQNVSGQPNGGTSGESATVSSKLGAGVPAEGVGKIVGPRVGDATDVAEPIDGGERESEPPLTEEEKATIQAEYEAEAANAPKLSIAQEQDAIAASEKIKIKKSAKTKQTTKNEPAPTVVPTGDYINDRSYHGTDAPGDRNTAIKYAAHEDVYDFYDKKDSIYNEDVQGPFSTERQKFVKKLTREEKALYNDERSKVAELEDKARAQRSKKKVTSLDKQMLAERKRRAEQMEALKQQLAIENQQEALTEEQAIAQQEVTERADAVNAQKQAARVYQGYETERVVGDVTKAINSIGDLDTVLEAIANDRRNGSITRSTAKALKRIIKKLKLDTDVLDINFGVLPKGKDGMFDPATNKIVLAADANGNYIGKRRIDRAVLHEIMHYLTDHVVDNFDAYVASLPPERRADAKAAMNRLKNNFKVVKAKFGKKYNIGNLKEFIAEIYSNPDLQANLAMMEPTTSTFKDVVNFFSEIARNIANVLGISSPSEGVTLKETYADIAQLISVPTAEMQGAKISYASDVIGTKAPKEPKKAHNEQTFEEAKLQLQRAVETKEGVPFVKNLFTTKEGWRWFVRKFQNQKEVLRRINNSIDRQAKLITTGNKRNDFAGQFDTSAAMAGKYYNEYLRNPSKTVNRLIGELASATGQTYEQALADAHIYLETLHEPERRFIKYLLDVPLSKAETLSFNGKKISPNGRRDQIMATIKNLPGTLSESQRGAIISSYRAELDSIVSNKKNLDTTGNRSTDINDAYYNVIAGRSPKTIAEFKARIEQQYTGKLDQLTAISDAVQEINKQSIALNKIGHYWSVPVDNIVAFYGFKNYVPFKGRPDAADVDAKLDPFSKKLAGDLAEGQDAFAGRQSESDNIVLQAMIEGTKASLRAGRKDLTLAIKNAVTQGYLKGKVDKPIKFDQRDRLTAIKELRGQNKIFHYEDNGDITVIELFDPEQREAIRRTYREDHPFVDILNNVTSMIGQFHTRYNPSFGPINFVGDLMTNSFTMGAEFGPKATFDLLKTVATMVGQGGIHKAGKAAYYYNNGRLGELRKYTNPKSPDYDAFYATLMEYLDRGGKISYMAGFNVQSQFDNLKREAKRNGSAVTKADVDEVVDVWTDMFELAARAAAYKVSKDIYLEQNEARGLKGKETLADAQQRATYYAKNLANFEQVGEYGKFLGAFYMFARPAATGAVRAIEALQPLMKRMAGEKFDLSTEEGRSLDAQAKSGAVMVLGLIGLGVATYTMSYMMADDDDEGRNRVATDDMDRWQRYARFHIPKYLTGGRDDIIFQSRWGYGLGAFASVGAQLAAMGAGNSSFKTTSANVMQAGLDSFLPIPISKINPFDNPAAFILDSVTPSAFRPFSEYVMNLDGLGREIYNNRQVRTGDAYTGGDSIPELYKSAARTLFDVTNGGIDISPNTMYFFANNGIDGLARITSGGYNLALVTAGAKEFNPKTDTILFDSFFGAKSNFDARQFSNVEKQVKNVEKRLKTLEADPIRYAEFVTDNPNYPAAVDFYNKAVNQDLKELRAYANQIRAQRDLTPKERKTQLDNITQMTNLVKRNLIGNFESLGFKP